MRCYEFAVPKSVFFFCLFLYGLAAIGGLFKFEKNISDFKDCLQYSVLKDLGYIRSIKKPPLTYCWKLAKEIASGVRCYQFAVPKSKQSYFWFFFYVLATIGGLFKFEKQIFPIIKDCLQYSVFKDLRYIRGIKKAVINLLLETGKRDSSRCEMLTRKICSKRPSCTF